MRVCMCPVCLLELTGVNYLDGGRGLAGAAADGLNGVDNFLARLDLTEDNVLSIEPVALDGGDEKLGAVGVLAGVGHGQQVWLVVLERKVLVGKLLAVDGLTACIDMK